MMDTRTTAHSHRANRRTAALKTIATMFTMNPMVAARLRQIKVSRPDAYEDAAAIASALAGFQGCHWVLQNWHYTPGRYRTPLMSRTSLSGIARDILLDTGGQTPPGNRRPVEAVLGSLLLGRPLLVARTVQAHSTIAVMMHRFKRYR